MYPGGDVIMWGKILFGECGAEANFGVVSTAAFKLLFVNLKFFCEV